MKTEDKLQFMTWARDAHAETNQLYDGLPYQKTHLRYVHIQYKKFVYLLHPEDRDDAFCGVWGHDLIEDARVTYNDISQQWSKRIADIIYACTEEKGRNREERHSEKYYTELGEDEVAIFVKLCDILANVTYSILTDSSMYKKHKEEHKKTLLYLYRPRYKPMFDTLETLFDVPIIEALE